MALIPASRIQELFDDESGGIRTVGLRIKNVDTADTIDLSSYFGEITAGTGLAKGTSAPAGIVVVDGTAVNAVILTLATMTNDNVDIVVHGTSA